MIELDGSYLEGGGSIVRVALAFSTLTQESFTITSIRKNRPRPGLKNQHLFCIKALEKLCNASSEGAFLGSTSLTYLPGKIEAKTIDIDIETAGSISLFLQSILLPSMFANKPIKLNITGGTDVKWAAPIDYFKEILLPQIQKYAAIECRLIKRGYYPKGNGKVEIKIKPIKNHPSMTDGFLSLVYDSKPQKLESISDKINLTEQGNLIQIKGVSHASSDLQNAQVADRQAKSAEISLSKFGCPVNIQLQYTDTLSTGSGIVLWAIFSRDKNEIDVSNPIRIGADALGKKQKKAELVGHEAAQNLIHEIESKAPVDKYLADQIIPFMALVGNSKIKTSNITNHTRTNIHTIEKFLGKTFLIDESNRFISNSNFFP